MKKHAFYLFVFLSLFTACGSDEEEPNHSQILGIWEISYIENLRLPEDDDRRRVEKADLETISSLDFRSDGTVSKQIFGSGSNHTANGVYTIQPFSPQEIQSKSSLSDALAVEITYTQTSSGFSPSSCGGSIEKYEAHPDGRLVNSAWTPCVGVLEVYTKL